MYVNEYLTFEEMFKDLNDTIVRDPDTQSPTRIGQANEIIGALVQVFDPTTYVMPDARINRIKYDYASKFWDFMISGGTDAEEAFKEFPAVAKFITKPKSPDLPDNFNTFYGPRIAAQLPNVIDELVRNQTTRRAVVLVLSDRDQIILDKDETLEYPCTISFSFQIRDDILIMQTNMRSQNVAVVLQLDIYLQGRLLELVANELRAAGVKIDRTMWQCFMQNAHVFDRDFDYVRGFTE